MGTADCHFLKIIQTQFQRFYFNEILVRKMLSVRQLALRSLLRPVATSSTTYKAKHTLPDLTYDYNALEPVISAEIMQLHHSKHHQTYVNMYNVAEEKLADAVSKGDASSIIGLQGALKFHGGGHINHSIFWQNLCPVSQSGEPSADLMAAIIKDFGSLENLQTQLSASTVAVGAGWVSIKQRKNCKLQLVQIKIHLKLQLVWFLCLELMFGNMLITSNTKMSGLTMSKLCGKLLIGLIFLIDL